MKQLGIIALILSLSGCVEHTESCQNALGCDREGHIIVLRGIGG